MTGQFRETLLSAALLLAAPAAAQPAAADPAPTAVTDARADPQTVTCRRLEVTGSRARKERICRTNAEWEKLARGARDATREVVDASQPVNRTQ